MKYKFISFDLDGTLLYDLTTISEENYEALRKLYDMGVTLVPTTGRALTEIPEKIRNCPYFKYAITSSGAYTHDLRSGEILNSHLISGEKNKEIFDTIYDYDIVSMVHFGGVNYVDKGQDEQDYDRCRLTLGFKKVIEHFGSKAEDYKSFASREGCEMHCVFFAKDEEKEECKRRLTQKGHTVVASAKDNIEVIAGDADKGLAAIALAKSLGIKEEETIGVGDSINDLALIKSVGLGIAMANGVDELKLQADAIGCSNKEHIARYILENFF